MLGGLTYDMVLVAMSDLYDALRQAEETASSQAQAAGPGEAWVPPDEFKRCERAQRGTKGPAKSASFALGHVIICVTVRLAGAPPSSGWTLATCCASRPPSCDTCRCSSSAGGEARIIVKDKFQYHGSRLAVMERLNI